MKDGTTHLAYKPEHAVDLATRVVVTAPIHRADEGDTTARDLDAIGLAPTEGEPCVVVADKGHHARELLRALDRGARRSGARGATKRAVRFGLYAAGWDLVIGPLGAVVVSLKEGLRAALSIAGVGVGLPGRSARAFLRGCYRLEGAAAVPALRASTFAAVVATLVAAVLVLGALAAAMML